MKPCKMLTITPGGLAVLKTGLLANGASGGSVDSATMRQLSGQRWDDKLHHASAVLRPHPMRIKRKRIQSQLQAFESGRTFGNHRRQCGRGRLATSGCQPSLAHGKPGKQNQLIRAQEPCVAREDNIAFPPRKPTQPAEAAYNGPIQFGHPIAPTQDGQNLALHAGTTMEQQSLGSRHQAVCICADQTLSVGPDRARRRADQAIPARPTASNPAMISTESKDPLS